MDRMTSDYVHRKSMGRTRRIDVIDLGSGWDLSSGWRHTPNPLLDKKAYQPWEGRFRSIQMLDVYAASPPTSG